MEERYVSIILPTYNRAHLIGESIGSIQRQTYPYWELIVIDDGSTDNTEEIVAEFMAADARIHYHRWSPNRGVSAARNEGIRQSRHEYIAFEDSDDLWREDKLQKQMQVFVDIPEARMVYCAYEGIKEDGTVIRVPNDSIKTDDLQGNLYKLLLQRNVIGLPTVMLHRQCLENCGVFNERLKSLEDWELLLRIAREYEIGYVKEPLLVANILEGGVSSRVGDYFFARCMMIAQHRADMIEYGIFDQMVEDVLLKAKDVGVFEQVAQMMGRMLAG